MEVANENEGEVCSVSHALTRQVENAIGVYMVEIGERVVGETWVVGVQGGRKRVTKGHFGQACHLAKARPAVGHDVVKSLLVGAQGGEIKVSLLQKALGIACRGTAVEA